MTIEDIRTTLKRGERLTLECKAAENGLPRSLWETYSAFANTVGGLILLGVRENKKESNPEKRHTFEGVDNVEKIVSDFWNTVNSDKVSENITLENHMNIFEIDGKKVVSIEVPQADWRSRPVFLNGNPYKGTYKRNHEGDYHCTREEVNTMIRDANPDGSDGILLDGFTMDDIDLDTLRSYRFAFRTLNPDHVWNLIEDDRIFLKKLGRLPI